MSFGRRHFFDNQLVAWKRTLRTADHKAEGSIDIYTNHWLLVTRENSQWRGVVACGEITNMWFTELNREKAPESSLNSYHENIFQHFLRSHPMMTLLNLFFFFCQMFYYRKILYQEKKEDEEGNLRIDCNKSSHLEGFFFQFKTETGICFLFFF